jgi:hypothetical protein
MQQAPKEQAFRYQVSIGFVAPWIWIGVNFGSHAAAAT